MKEKVREIFKSYLPGFILGIISVCIITVYAETYFPSNQTTYDNTNSKLKSENVQDAIDELYGVCFPKPAGEQIIENAGLEKDPYECRYFFTGANPNNYITFNNEKAGWRIISVECDGTIKIMRTESIGDMVWDISGSNNWARPASLNTYLNGTYYNGLNGIAQSQIIAKDWSIGAVKRANNNLSAQINDENGIIWNGKIALPTVSEYIRTNSNKSTCGTFSLINSNGNFITCRNTTWMYMNDYWWTASPYDGNSNNTFLVHSGGYVNGYNVASRNYAVRPTLYLTKKTKIISGNGSQSDPYELSL